MFTDGDRTFNQKPHYIYRMAEVYQMKMAKPDFEFLPCPREFRDLWESKKDGKVPCDSFFEDSHQELQRTSSESEPEIEFELELD